MTEEAREIVMEMLLTGRTLRYIFHPASGTCGPVTIGNKNPKNRREISNEVFDELLKNKKVKPSTEAWLVIPVQSFEEIEYILNIDTTQFLEA